MRNLTTSMCLIAVMVMVQRANAVTGLAAGDIALIGFNADGNDDFGFVALEDLDVGTTIHFTDNEWNGAALTTGEGIISWTATSSVAAGSVVVINDPSATISATTGVVSESGAFNLSASGDQILAYQGSNAAPTFVYGLHTDSVAWGSGGSQVPTGLTDGVDALASGSFGVGADIDNGQYTGIRSGSKTVIAAAIAAMDSNWTFSNGTGDQSLAIDDTVFTITTSGPTKTLFAGTSFEEPTDGGSSTDTDTSDHFLSNADGATVSYTSIGGELGFTSFFSNSNGGDGVNNDFIGVTDFTSNVGAYTDGVQGFEIADPDGTLTVTLDSVDLTGVSSPMVMVDVFLKDDTYEDADSVRVFVELDGGATTLELFNLSGDLLEAIGGQWLTISGDLSGHSSAVLKLEATSSANDEIAYFDNVQFLGVVDVAAVPEPATAMLGLIGMAGLITRRRHC